MLPLPQNVGNAEELPALKRKKKERALTLEPVTYILNEGVYVSLRTKYYHLGNAEELPVLKRKKEEEL